MRDVLAISSLGIRSPISHMIGGEICVDILFGISECNLFRELSIALAFSLKLLLQRFH